MLVETYEFLERTGARLKKTEAIAGLLRETPGDELEKVALLIQGRVFPSWDEREIGIANLLMLKIIKTVTGFPEREIGEKFRRAGDFGLVIEELVAKKRQKTLFRKPLTIRMVFENLQKLAEMTGKGSQDRKFHLVSELIGNASPKEAKYIVRTTLGDLRIGVAEGVARDAIAEAFLPMDTKEEARESSRAVEWAWFLRPDYGEIAKIAKERGLPGLKSIRLEPGKPYHVLLSEKAPDLKTALEAFGRAQLEYKYDGARLVIQKRGREIWLFTRRLENVTRQFPELVELARKCLGAGKCIVEGEMLGINKKTGRPMPFQFLSQRIKRKYDIEKLQEEIPIQVNLFDITYLNGKQLFGTPLEGRRRELEKIIKPVRGKFQLAKALITKDLEKAQKFYQEALDANQEGLIVKNLDARYQPGRRVGYWLKVKPVLESLDLAITGAQWGRGKRAGWLGSFILSCRDPRTGEYLECGMLGTGIKEKIVSRPKQSKTRDRVSQTRDVSASNASRDADISASKIREEMQKTESGDITFRELSDMLKPHITGEEAGTVKIRPRIVAEVSYEEIQRSPNYASGYALRFPRFLRLRTSEKPAEQCDTLDRVERIYKMQKGKRGG